MMHGLALDALDLQRLGLLLLACAELSRDRYVLVRYSASQAIWRVNVRYGHPQRCPCHACPVLVEHTSSSKESPLLALDRACQWLRTTRARVNESRIAPVPA